MNGWNTEGHWYGMGVEEEFALVDNAGRLADLAPQMLIDAPEHVTGELLQCMIETTTEPVLPDDLPAALERSRTRAQQLAQVHGCHLHAQGTHAQSGTPLAVSCEPRYEQIARSLPEIRRLLVCGMHVHVCVPDPDKAVQVHRTLSALAPALLALSANSPLWDGKDSGAASERAHHLTDVLPNTGSSPAWSTWNEYEHYIKAEQQAGHIVDETYLWHDVRLHPRYGTVEVRVLDVQSELADATALALLVQRLGEMAGEGHLLDYDRALAERQRACAAQTGCVQVPSMLTEAISSLDETHRRRLERLREHPGYARVRNMA